LWAEKTMEMTNIASGALFFGQFFSDKSFSFLPAIIGVLFLVFGYIASLILLNKK
jgi:hypothetical protein